MRQYEVIVVGAGHAGCEAALASARLGARTAMVTMDRDGIARMSCNPSVGGIAKSHLVFEIDALGGEMAKNADYTGIQFRTLNTRKGPAVQANRVQCDKDAYSARMRSILEHTANLDLVYGTASSIAFCGTNLRGIQMADGSHLSAKCVVLAPGTFLRGRIHIGDQSYPGGRDGESAADSISESLSALGFRISRLKTGTPPRLRACSIDYGRMKVQPGENPPPFFSWQARRYNKMFHVEHLDRAMCPWETGSNQIPCYLTETNTATHDIVKRNLSRSALYGGHIVGTGVRYCPSLEDKIVKFEDKPSHHVFIEPEGRHLDTVYPNGISNSLPADAQLELVHSIHGLERSEIVKLAYAIEYDFCDPTQLSHTLESKLIECLFLAGQLNGTTGYEEAAAQGFMAGVNAALKAQGRQPLVLGRHEAYIGVLIDDLVTKGTNEPYRMFTSRAEHRLVLRQDNARFRLLSHARQLGIADPSFVRETEEFEMQVTSEIARLQNERLESGETACALLKRHDTRYDQLPCACRHLPQEVVRQVEIRVKYQGYIDREIRRIHGMQELENLIIPSNVDYWSIPQLRYEVREKLSRIRPRNLAQASRIPGVNPPDISILSVLLRSNGTQRRNTNASD